MRLKEFFNSLNKSYNYLEITQSRQPITTDVRYRKTKQ